MMSDINISQLSVNNGSLEIHNEVFNNQVIPPPYSPFPNASSIIPSNASFHEPFMNFCMNIPPVKKLGHMDFVPRIIQKRLLKDDLYDSQGDLVQRVNTWLGEHPGLQVVSCESMVWYANNYKDIFSDSSICIKETDIFNEVTFIRGIRLWFITDIIPNPNTCIMKIDQIKCETYIPKVKERFYNLINRVNKEIVSENCKIVKIEIIKMLVKDGYVSSESTYWTEANCDDKMFIWALRVFSFVTEQLNTEIIGYQDFVPEYLKKSRDNKGYELFSDIMDKASRWLSRQKSIRFSNMQTIPIKIKKVLQFEERCKFTEHSRTPTEYLQTLRVFYLLSQVNMASYPTARLSFRTFIPCQVSFEKKSKEVKYESVKSIVYRINEWIKLTGARLADIETIILNVHPDIKVQMLGSEATFISVSLDGKKNKQLFLIRIYLDGEYPESDSAASLVNSTNLKYTTSAFHNINNLLSSSPPQLSTVNQTSPIRFLDPSGSFQGVV